MTVIVIILSIVSGILVIATILSYLEISILGLEIRFNYLPLNRKALDLAIKFSYSELLAIANSYKVPIFFRDDKVPEDAVGVYRRMFERDNFLGTRTFKFHEIALLKKYSSLEEETLNEGDNNSIMLLAHEIGHCVKVAENNDTSEEAADGYIREFFNTIPIWVQATLECAISAHSHTETKTYNWKEVRNSLKSYGLLEKIS